MTKKQITLCCISLLFMAGCALTRASVGVRDVPLLPEDGIYNVIEGQSIKVISDKKQVDLTTTDRMVITFQDNLVRKNEKLNKAAMKQTFKGVAMGAIVPVLIIIGQILLRSRRKMKIEGNIKAEG